MKAEHRKELETNVLASRLADFVRSVRQGPRRTSIVVWVFVFLALAAGGAWYYYGSVTAQHEAILWVNVDTATAEADLKKLQELAEDNPGTIPGRTARFQRARIQLHQGLQHLGSPARRTQAIDDLEAARQVYAQLRQETSDAPLLYQEALMGLAKAEEALIGVPSLDKPGEFRGSFDKALEYYEELAQAQPTTFQTESAARYAKELRAKAAQVRAFYAELSRLSKP